MQDSDEVVEHFQLKLDAVIQKTVPRTRKRMNKYPPWFSRDIIRVIKDREKTRKKFKRTGDLIHWQSLRTLRNKSKKMIRVAYKNHFQEVEKNLHKDPSKFWIHIKNKNRCTAASNVRQYKG